MRGDPNSDFLLSKEGEPLFQKLGKIAVSFKSALLKKEKSSLQTEAQQIVKALIDGTSFKNDLDKISSLKEGRKDRIKVYFHQDIIKWIPDKKIIEVDFITVNTGINAFDQLRNTNNLDGVSSLMNKVAAAKKIISEFSIPKEMFFTINKSIIFSTKKT